MPGLTYANAFIKSAIDGELPCHHSENAIMPIIHITMLPKKRTLTIYENRMSFFILSLCITFFHYKVVF